MIARAIAVWVLASACRAADPGWIEPPPDGTKVTCPVSGDTCEKTPTTRAAVFAMRTYYFCCDDCPARFAADPARYVRRVP
jgi:YHS domain-containing protein